MAFVYRWQPTRMMWQQGRIGSDLNTQMTKENHITMYKPLNPHHACMDIENKKLISDWTPQTLKFATENFSSPDHPFRTNLKADQFSNHIHQPWPFSQILLSRIKQFLTISAPYHHFAHHAFTIATALLSSPALESLTKLEITPTDPFPAHITNHSQIGLSFFTFILLQAHPCRNPWQSWRSLWPIAFQLNLKATGNWNLPSSELPYDPSLGFLIK